MTPTDWNQWKTQWFETRTLFTVSVTIWPQSDSVWTGEKKDEREVEVTKKKKKMDRAFWTCESTLLPFFATYDRIKLTATLFYYEITNSNRSDLVMFCLTEPDHMDIPTTVGEREVRGKCFERKENKHIQTRTEIADHFAWGVKKWVRRGVLV